MGFFLCFSLWGFWDISFGFSFGFFSYITDKLYQDGVHIDVSFGGLFGFCLFGLKFEVLHLADRALLLYY